jgi:NAD(P)-dependent dehydrogenase (short-subunit alcohol dehydrogenase family)
MTGRSENKSGFSGATNCDEFFKPGQPKIDLSGKYAVVTGGTNGIGKHTAVTLVRGGANVVIVGRNQAKVDRVVKELKDTVCKDFPGTLEGMCCDLSKLASVKAFTKAYEDKGHALDILVNNAGIMAVPKREETEDGFESQMGTNHLGHFALTGGLMNSLLKSEAPRVVCLSSVAHTSAKEDFLADPKLESETYKPWTAYGNAKFANAVFAEELHKRYNAQGLQAASVHPGGIHTGLQTHVGWGIGFLFRIAAPFIFKNINQGAATSIFCAVVVDKLNGSYYEDCNESRISYRKRKFLTEENLKKFWETSEKLTGVTFPTV